jgi:uncharacterized lipoprotein YddW (UPF0748 family)
MIYKHKCAVLLILFACILLPTSLVAEIRSLWILPWSITSPQKIDDIIADAVNANQTELLVEVRYRSDALYTTNRLSSKYNNPEPKSYILNGSSFDPLEYAINAGHANNLTVQAWVVVFNATPLDSSHLSKNYIYNNHQDWITYTKQQQRMKGSEQFGFFIDPGIPEVQNYLLSVFSDIAEGYPDLDGLHLDYIRYPSSDLGFHPTSVARYHEQLKSTPNLTWNQWRMQMISGFVQRVYHQVKSINPDLMLTAAVFANYSDAIVGYAQAWEDWLEGGYIDRVYPMAYEKKAVNFTRHIKRMESMPRTKDIVIGLRAWKAGNASLLSGKAINGDYYSLSEVEEKVDIVRSKDFGGIALFSYDGLKPDNALQVLAQRVYQTNPNDAGFTQIMEDMKPLVHTVQTNVVTTVETTIETTRKQEVSKQEPASTPTEFLLDTDDNNYRLTISVPTEGRWKWEILNPDNSILYQRYRYYLSGKNVDFWNGIMDNGSLVPTGEYVIHIFREGDNLSQRFPVKLFGIPQ